MICKSININNNNIYETHMFFIVKDINRYIYTQDNKHFLFIISLICTCIYNVNAAVKLS